MKTLDAETVVDGQEKALARVERHESAVARALSVSEMTDRLKLIKGVMQENMTVDVDYGKVPGCGDKPGLFQPGAQKLSMMFQLSPEVREETISEFENYHRGYRTVVRVSNGPKFADGVGECSTLESKYRYRNASKTCPVCGKATVFRQKEGKGWYCWTKKGGCGQNFAPDSPNAKTIDSQSEAKAENENPPDHWNTVRKMAFKRAFVHAIINATNTSELWSQDLEDLNANRVTRGDNDADATHSRQQNNSGVSGSGERKASPPTDADPKKPLPFGTNAKSSKPFPTDKTRMWFLNKLQAAPGQPREQIVKAYCMACGELLETESLVDLPLRFVGRDLRDVGLFEAGMSDWQERDAEGGAMPAEAHKPFVNEEPNLGAGGDGESRPARKSGTTAARGSTEPESKAVPENRSATASSKPARPSYENRKSPEWWYDVPIHVPRKGMKLAEYVDNMDTIGSLYELRHEDNEEAHSLRKRLFGLVKNFTGGWTKNDGTKVAPTKDDAFLREALDAFAEFVEAKGERI